MSAVEVAKPRLTYAQFIAQQPQKPTIAILIDRYISDMEGIRPVGDSQKYTMRKTSRSPLGAKIAEKLTKADVIGYCRMRRQQCVRNTTRLIGASTVNQEMSFIGVVLKYASAAWEDCGEVSAAPIIAARPFLLKLGVLGKSKPRNRRPTDAEIHALLDFYAKQMQHPRTEIDMAMLMAFGLVSTRRLGEMCRITRGDINWQKRTYIVRDLKHPTKKKGNDKEFALFDELADIIQRMPLLDANDPTERIFPFNSKSCSQNYADAKRRLGIVGLRFHDNRREAISRWLRKLPPHKVRQISGHENTVILERVYDAPRAEDLHADLVIHEAAIQRSRAS